MVGFGEYDRKARLTPGLLAGLPVAYVVVALGLKRYPVVAIAAGTVGAAGAAYLLAVLVRHMGLRCQVELWQSWGGPPTTSLLRTREQASNPVLRDQWRNAIQQVTGVELLTAEQEANDPVTADQRLEAAVTQVLYLGQDSRYPLVQAENTQYGFERNFYAIRWLARAIAGLAIVVLVVVLAWGAHSDGNGVSTGGIVAAIVVSVVSLVTWFVAPSAGRTRAAANRYANQLLKAVTQEAKQSK